MEEIVTLIFTPEVILLALFVNILTYILKSFCEGWKEDIPRYCWKAIWTGVPFILAYCVSFALGFEIMISLTASIGAVILYNFGIKKLIKLIGIKFNEKS